METAEVTLRSRIYAHRGCWDSMIPQNSLTSFQIASRDRFSIETDIRQLEGNLIVSHDSPKSSTPLKFLDLRELESTLAINLKEDGLQDKIAEERAWIEKTGSFVFDGSIPEMYRFRMMGISHALRLSEYEKELPWVSHAIWLDSFDEDWWIKDASIQHLIENSNTIVVSPELHGRDPRFVWDTLAERQSDGYSNFSICTDRPSEYLAWI